ncbi:CdaR family protein [Ulvibacter antarcticus]|uniref:YbbR-like protein n=1 Tax=Ulvibacter antarcticus TaxID=442714 RepID=A0A3L9YYL8_9FLAO|nr:CdaR family protein [Ulvibacter antarcticus]RMA64897.1 YbbR-like protein [Ulvibacter antarcticus]
MKKQLKNPFKNTKFKAFLFFLFLATFFWVLTKFSRQYTASATMDIHCINVPATTMLAHSNYKSIDVDLTTNGFEFLYYKLNRPDITIDVASFYKEGSKEVIIPSVDLARMISSRLKSNIAVNNILVDNLIVKLDEIISKKVPVFSEVNLEYKNGFRAVDTVSVSPDSVNISGPSEYVEKIDIIRTDNISEKNIDKNVIKTVKLQNPDVNNLIIDISEVTIEVKVAEFSQNEVILNVEIINAPESTIIKLIPEVVTVTFDASVDDFKGISKQEFRLVCDYTERNKEENFMIPKLIKHPKGIVNILIDSEKIDYLIFK